MGVPLLDLGLVSFNFHCFACRPTHLLNNHYWLRGYEIGPRTHRPTSSLENVPGGGGGGVIIYNSKGPGVFVINSQKISRPNKKCRPMLHICSSNLHVICGKNKAAASQAPRVILFCGPPTILTKTPPPVFILQFFNLKKFPALKRPGPGVVTPVTLPLSALWEKCRSCSMK